MRMSFSPKSESKSVSVPVAVYAIIIIGTTVSLAGKPSIKAVNMTPSSPMSFAKGSSAPEKQITDFHREQLHLPQARL